MFWTLRSYAPGVWTARLSSLFPTSMQSRQEILKVHAAGMAKHGEIDYEAAAKLAEGFNAADMRNVCTEAGMAAIWVERDYAINEDFMQAVRKLTDTKKLESSADYKADFGKD